MLFRKFTYLKKKVQIKQNGQFSNFHNHQHHNCHSPCTSYPIPYYLQVWENAYLSASWIQWSVYTFYKKRTSFPNKIQSLSRNITMKKASSNKVKGNRMAEFQLCFSELPFTLAHSDFKKSQTLLILNRKWFTVLTFLVYHKLFIKCPLCL